MSGAVFLGCALGVDLFAGAQFAWNPFGNSTGSPGHPSGPATRRPLRSAAIWIIGWFGYLNYVSMLVNLLPALPFDGGRMFRAYLCEHVRGFDPEILMPLDGPGHGGMLWSSSAWFAWSVHGVPTA